MSGGKDPVILDDRYVVCSQKLNQKEDVQVSVIGLEKKFMCDFCSKRFGTKNELSVHLRVHTGEKPYECELCNKKFSQKGQLQNHYKMHITIDTSQNKVEPLSDLTLTQKLINTSKLNESEYEHPCDICEKRFATQALLSVHLRVHTKEKPYECELCQKKFSQVGNLKTHYLIHTNKRPFKCKICMKSFVQKGNLQTHYKTHTKEKPFQCSACNKNFTQRGNLISHERSHHFTEKPFECSVCHKTFATKFYFQKHSQMHIPDASRKDSLTPSATETPSPNLKELSVISSYECTVCNSSFDKKRDLNLHYRVHANIVASKLNQISCEQSLKGDNTSTSNDDSTDNPLPSGPCVVSIIGNASQPESQTSDSQLPSENSMSDIDYLIDTNDNSFICGKCNKTFSGKPSFLVHYRIHTGVQLFECGICNKKFNQKQSLEYHERTHTGKRPYKCDLCTKSFTQNQNLLVHLRTHTGERPYRCEECPKQFCQKHSLLLHNKTAHGGVKLDTDFMQKRLVGVTAASYKQFKQKLVLRRQQDSQTWTVYNAS